MSTDLETKKKSNSTIILIVILVVAAIGGAILYQKGKSDTYESVRTEEMRQQNEAARKQKIAELRGAIPQKKAELQMAYNKLEDVNSFHLLRTKDEKEAQLAEQYKVIDELKNDLSKLENQLSALQ